MAALNKFFISIAPDVSQLDAVVLPAFCAHILVDALTRREFRSLSSLLASNRASLGPA